MRRRAIDPAPVVAGGHLGVVRCSGPAGACRPSWAVYATRSAYATIGAIAHAERRHHATTAIVRGRARPTCRSGTGNAGSHAPLYS